MAREFKNVGVIGLGTMGAGIAEVFAREGLSVVAIEADDAAVARGRGHVENSTGRAVARGKLSTEDQQALLDRISFGSSLDALAEVDLDLRGEGTLLGSRQRGRSDLHLASLRRDEDLLIDAQRIAAAMVARDALDDEPEMVDELRLFIDDEEATFLFKS